MNPSHAQTVIYDAESNTPIFESLLALGGVYGPVMSEPQTLEPHPANFAIESPNQGSPSTTMITRGAEASPSPATENPNEGSFSAIENQSDAPLIIFIVIWCLLACYALHIAVISFREASEKEESTSGEFSEEIEEEIKDEEDRTEKSAETMNIISNQSTHIQDDKPKSYFMPMAALAGLPDAGSGEVSDNSAANDSSADAEGSKENDASQNTSPPPTKLKSDKTKKKKGQRGKKRHKQSKDQESSSPLWDFARYFTMILAFSPIASAGAFIGRAEQSNSGITTGQSNSMLDGTTTGPPLTTTVKNDVSFGLPPGHWAAMFPIFCGEGTERGHRPNWCECPVCIDEDNSESCLACREALPRYGVHNEL